MENVTIFDHPLIQHKISILRDKATGTNEFRSLIEEIAMLMGYEALRDLPLEDKEVETPIETCMTPMLAGKKLAVVPILRAGLGMVNGCLLYTSVQQLLRVFPQIFGADLLQRLLRAVNGQAVFSGQDAQAFDVIRVLMGDQDTAQFASLDPDLI